MLIVNPHREVDWPVEINVPQDGGTVDKTEVTIRYRLATQDDWSAMGDKPAREFMANHVIGWDGFVDEKEKPIKFNTKSLDALLKIGYIERAMTRGLISASSGSAAKN